MQGHGDYVVLRVGRRFMPAAIVRFLLHRHWLIEPGLETRDAPAAVARYAQALQARGVSWVGQRVMVFGYGGNFAVGAELLRLGAAHVVLCDKFAVPNHQANARLASHYPQFLTKQGKTVLPRPQYFTLIHDDIRSPEVQQTIGSVDLVLSSSVYEHLNDVEGVTRALVRLTSPGGFHLHFVDLRDHFFKYPFEMLTYPDAVWQRWLNPSSHLNRLRIWDYERILSPFFASLEVQVLSRDEEAFRRAKARILPQYLSGDEARDAVTKILLFGQVP
ncbi:MAG: methyltransferase domain-containing protein [Chloroflexi bacterium]|nr:methyltransferase domain-containing protein [Chloroflexota bacterium]